jgi:hypothetical protein
MDLHDSNLIMDCPDMKLSFVRRKTVDGRRGKWSDNGHTVFRLPSPVSPRAGGEP